MAQYYPIVVQSGQSLVGDSLGFHAYSLRLDNCTNQWLLEESTMAYIPPYSLGMCLRLYGTGVAILLDQAPVGQPQLAPIVGEQVVGVYSDQLRTEVAASPIRQFTLVQAVSDLTEGPQPALPPVGVDRLYADASGNIHHLHSNGTDLTLVDPSNAGALLYASFDPHYQALMSATALGGDLNGTVSNGHINNGVIGLNSPIIQNGAINAAKIQPNTLGDPQIAPGGISGTSIAAQTISASNIQNNTIGDQQIGVAAIHGVSIASGAIGTAQLAGNAAAYVNWYVAFNSFSTSSTSTVATGITLSLTLIGSPLLVSFSAPIYTTAAAGVFVSYRIDGGAWNTIMFYNSRGSTNTDIVVAKTVLSGLSAATHTIDIGISVSTGTLTFNAAAPTVLECVELRR